jgi:predicted nucleic acid-binding protein
MARVRKILRSPTEGRNYYVVDANFLVNRFIPPSIAPAGIQRTRIEQCNDWWAEIESQLNQDKARVYVPDICIAESFKVLAKKYYEDKWFARAADLNNARVKLRKAITTPPSTLRRFKRRIRFHDVPSSRDIVISVDRFYELFHKHKKKVSLPDLLLVATAKYLCDFFDLTKPRIHIVTLDRPLWEGTKKIQELPNAYDPTHAHDLASRVFK